MLGLCLTLHSIRTSPHVSGGKERARDKTSDKLEMRLGWVTTHSKKKVKVLVNDNVK